MSAESEETILDVRPDLANGEEPFVKIMVTAARIPENGILHLIAPFNPVPLYSVLDKRGFVHAETKSVSATEWHVFFVRKDPQESASEE